MNFAIQKKQDSLDAKIKNLVVLLDDKRESEKTSSMHYHSPDSIEVMVN